jgi:hypothetical protein
VNINLQPLPASPSSLQNLCVPALSFSFSRHSTPYSPEGSRSTTHYFLVTQEARQLFSHQAITQTFRHSRGIPLRLKQSFRGPGGDPTRGFSPLAQLCVREYAGTPATPFISGDYFTIHGHPRVGYPFLDSQLVCSFSTAPLLAAKSHGINTPRSSLKQTTSTAFIISVYEKQGVVCGPRVGERRADCSAERADVYQQGAKAFEQRATYAAVLTPLGQWSTRASHKKPTLDSICQQSSSVRPVALSKLLVKRRHATSFVSLTNAAKPARTSSLLAAEPCASCHF